MAKKVLIIRNAFLFDFGGGERFPVHLAKELEKSDINSVIVSRSPKLLEYARNQGIMTVRGWWWSKQDWSGRNILLLPLYIIWLIILTIWYLRLALKFQVDILHPQSKDDFIAATLAGSILRKRTVWTDHADLKYIYQNHGIWYKNPIGKLVYALSKLAGSVTLVSYSEQRLIETQLGHPVPGNYRVIHNGVLDENILPVQRDKNTIIFCATSRLVTAKGIGELINSFKSLSSTNEHLQLWLVGDGPERAKFEAQADRDTRVTFVGHTDAPLTYVAACDVFVHPSHHEGFSLSLVEAAMVGKPIIACNVGGNPEIVQDNKTGLLIKEQDEKSLSVAMERLATNINLRKKLGGNARDLFVKDFQFDKLVKERFLPLYEK